MRPRFGLFLAALVGLAIVLDGTAALGPRRWGRRRRAVGVVVVVDTAAAAFRAAAGAAMAAVEAFHEEAMAGKAVTLAAVGVRQRDPGLVVAGVIFLVPLAEAILVGVTFPAPPAEAIFPRPTFQEATSQAPPAPRDPAAGVSHRAARNVLRPALVRPAAERPSSPRAIGHLPVVRAMEKELAPRNNRPAEPSRPGGTRKLGPVTSRRSFRRKAPVIFSGRQPELVPGPHSAAQLPIARASSRQIGGVLVRDPLALNSVRTGVIARKIATTNGASGSITAAKPGPSGANKARTGATSSKTIAISVGIICKAGATIARNGATRTEKTGSNIAKTFGIIEPTVRMRSGTTRRIFTMTSSMMPGGDMRDGVATGLAIIRSIHGGGGGLPRGTRSRPMPRCHRNLSTSITE